MPGTLSPFPRWQVFDSDGAPLDGALLYTYLAGTTTPATTYNDSDLDPSHANANPIEADAGGLFGPIFLDALSYKFILKTSAGVIVWSQDEIISTAVAAAEVTRSQACDGRMTLSSVTPVTIADVTAATTVYFTPYEGNRISLYDGTNWNEITFTEKALALGTDTTGKNYDLFGYLSAGALAIERLVWASDTVRGTALVVQDGVLVKSGSPTRRYLGTYRTTGAGQTEDSFAKRFCWNYYHRVERPMRVVEATATWDYSVATFRQARASGANQLALVIGVAEVAVSASVQGRATNDNATAISQSVAIAYDSTSVPTTGCVMSASVASNTVGIVGAPTAELRHFPAVGYHVYVWLEYAVATGTTTWSGTSSVTFIQCGITGSVWG